MLDTSELLGSEVLAIEIAGLGSPVYYDASFQSGASSSGVFQVQKVSKLDAALQVQSGATLSLKTLKFAHGSFASVTATRLVLLANQMPRVSFASNGASLSDIGTVKVKRAQVEIDAGQSAVDFKTQKFSVGAMDSSGTSYVDFARPTQVALSEIDGISSSDFDPRSIGLAQFIDQVDAMPRFAELRGMSRGPGDVDMAVFAAGSMSRLAEGRNMVAP